MPKGKPYGKGQDDFMQPPNNLREKTDTWKGYSRQERDRTLYYLETDPESLQESLRKWLLALFAEGPCSMKRVNFLLFCQRAIRIQEFMQINEESDTLLQAVVICCGQFPNPQAQREVEEKCMLARLQQKQKQQEHPRKGETRDPDQDTREKGSQEVESKESWQWHEPVQRSARGK